MHRHHTVKCDASGKLGLRLSKVKIFLYALPDVMLRANVTTLKASVRHQSRFRNARDTKYFKNDKRNREMRIE